MRKLEKKKKKVQDSMFKNDHYVRFILGRIDDVSLISENEQITDVLFHVFNIFFFQE